MVGIQKKCVDKKLYFPFKTWKQVNIKINGQPMDVQMAIGMYGKAYLLQEVSEYESTEIIQNLISTLFPSEDNANQRYR